MANETARRDDNKIPVLLALRTDTGEIIQLRADSTGALATTGGAGGGGGGLTDTQLRASVVPVSLPGAVALDAGTLAALETISVANFPADLETGTWSYYGGSVGTVAVSAGQRVIGIAAHATTAGSMSINGGASVPIPANSSLDWEPHGNLVAPSITFTGTDSYVVEVVS